MAVCLQAVRHRVDDAERRAASPARSTADDHAAQTETLARDPELAYPAGLTEKHRRAIEFNRLPDDRSQGDL